MKNRHIPQAQFSKEGQYLLDTENRRYAAMLSFIKTLSTGGNSMAVDQIMNEARIVARGVERTTYTVEIVYGPDDEATVCRVEEVTFARPANRLQDAVDVACDRIYDDPDFQPLGDFSIASAKVTKVR